MKNYKLPFFFILILLCAGLGYYSYKQSNIIADTINNQNDEITVGFYDRKHKLPVVNPDSVVHFSMKWYNNNSNVNLNGIPKKNNDYKLLLITLEVWPEKGKNVLDEILDGAYNSKINNFASAISDMQRIMIRFLPEMEVPVHEFPWQYQSPDKYIKAFNYFAERLKQSAPSVIMTWSPSGYPGDSEFWPGPKNVDAISITFGSNSEKLSTAFPTYSTLETLNNKIHRMRYMDKPILILSANKKTNRAEMADMLIKTEKQIDSFKNTIYVANDLKPSTIKPQRDKLIIGAYDPKMILVNDPAISAEHIFTDWKQIETGTFSRDFNEVVKRNHDVIVTVEPWWNDTSGQIDDNVLQNTVKGKYDKLISKLYKELSNTSRKVYLRWAHEMEIPIHRYTWQSQSFIDYINSFRYFMNFQKRSANILSVWGPAGDRGSIDWYPGDDVVDYISVAIYGLPDKNITDQHQQESFDAIFKRKYYRMRFINKPVFITEFGVKGTEDYKRNWLKDAATTINNNKQIYGICYFNLHDNPKVWGDIKAPDWSIKPQTFKTFYKALND